MRIHGLVKRIKHYFFPGTIILLYHRVIDLKTDPYLLAVSPKRFSEQISYLKNHYHIISLDQLITSLQQGIFPQNSLVITFDDGYLDNYTYAKPILEQLQVPATIFVSTGNLGRNEEFWWDALERLFLIGENLPSDIELALPTKKRHWKLTTPEEMKTAQHELHSLFREMSPDMVRKSLTMLSSRISVPPGARPEFRVMNEEELRDLASSRFITLGAHTHSHTKLANQTRSAQRADILMSKKILEQILNRNIKHFSYPFGTMDDYNLESLEVVRELGFLSACSNFPGVIRKKVNPYKLPRFLMRNWNEAEFRANINSFFCW
ncbi:polysaccharide deacetylase family protein [Candidatus Peregrinibacteria bacterium]|nr:polysaccharide deacetylase family protein [Candidatus Peregrinibacteria bacterium]